MQTDAGIEVCQRLGYFIPAFSSIASRMTPGQRAVSMLYVLRDFSPLGITIAMVALPLAIALFPSDRCAQITHQHAGSFSLLKKLAITLWTARTINTWLMYGHVGLGRLANFQSQEIWTAPCEFNSIEHRSVWFGADFQQTRHTATSSLYFLKHSPPRAS